MSIISQTIKIKENDIVNFIGDHKNPNKIIDKMLNATCHPCMLFVGARGIGKKTMVMHVVMKYLREYDTANHISNPITHPDVFYLKKTDKMILADDIRNTLQFLSMKSSVLPSKVVIIDSIDDMNVSSSNMLLKAMEDSGAYFMLISHSIAAVMKTIKSRCIIIRCIPPSIDDCAMILKNIGIENDIAIEYGKFARFTPGMMINLIQTNALNHYIDMLNLLSGNMQKSQIEFITTIMEYNLDVITFILTKFVSSLGSYIFGGQIHLDQEMNAMREYVISHRLTISDYHLLSTWIFEKLFALHEYDLKLESLVTAIIQTLMNPRVHLDNIDIV